LSRAFFGTEWCAFVDDVVELELISGDGVRGNLAWFSGSFNERVEFATVFENDDGLLVVNVFAEESA
jgi:hypothetical protein